MLLEDVFEYNGGLFALNSANSKLYLLIPDLIYSHQEDIFIRKWTDEGEQSSKDTRIKVSDVMKAALEHYKKNN